MGRKLLYFLRKLGILELFLLVVVLFFLLQTIIIIWSSFNIEVLSGNTQCLKCQCAGVGDGQHIGLLHWHFNTTVAGLSRDANGLHTVLLDPQPTVNSRGPCYKNVTVDVHRGVDSLLEQVADHPDWTWLVKRVRQQWLLWQQHLGDFKLPTYRQKRVLLVPGLLLGTDFAKNSSVQGGGPLGDLVQWADLILGLHALGHRITLMRDIYEAARGIRYDRFGEQFVPGCPTLPYDLIYTDIITVKALPPDVTQKARCELRVLDAYGTEAMYNWKDYAIKHGFLSPYGQLNLHLKQFLTFYPHTPDNSFLGFAVVPAEVSKPEKKLNMGLLYGKKPAYFAPHQDYMQYLMKHMELHSTVANTSTLPDGVQHHGVVSPMQYKELLKKAKFLVGFGEPLESTGVMEALGHGCIFLNPQFRGKDRDLLQTMGKPTSRKLSSQVGYLESLGPPHVLTVNMENFTQIQHAVTNAKQVLGYVPALFSIEVFVRRLHWLMEEQAICGAGGDGTEDVEVAQGGYGESCTQACYRKGVRVCDPSLFPQLQMDMFKPPCQHSATAKEESIYYPARTNHAKCLQPRSNALFSCAGQHEALQRLCACRKHNALIDP